MGVEKRLDEIFAEDMKSKNLQKAKIKIVKPPSLANLRNIIMSMEWEVTDDLLKELMQELSRLQKAYNKDSVLQKLFRLLVHLSRYIKVHKSDTHPYIFKMLFQAHNGLTKIASGKCSNYQKAKIVNDEIKRYISLKSYLERKNKNISRRTVNKINALEKDLLSPIDSFSKQRPYPSKDTGEIQYRTINIDFVELKKFFYLEIKKLRRDLQRIATLIHAKT